MGLLRRRLPNVERMKRKGDADGLVRALGYEDLVADRDGNVMDLGANVRRAATAALAQIDSRAAANGLVRALDDPLPDVRIAAIRGLRERGDPLAAEELIAAATNWTEPEYAAARAEAVDALTFLRDPMTPRRVAAALLTRSAELDDVADAALFRKLARAGGHDAVVETVADLVGRLREGSAPARTRTLLVWLAPDSVPPLVESLAVVPARGEAIAALAATRDARAVEGLCSVLLGGDEPHVRAAAARALGEIRDPAAVEALLLASRDPDYEVRTAAGDGFDKLGNAAVAVAIMSLVQPVLENGSGGYVDEIAEGGEPERDLSAEPEGPEPPDEPDGPEEPEEPPPVLDGSRSQPAPERTAEGERRDLTRQRASADAEESPYPAVPGRRRPEWTALTQVSPIIRRWLGRRGS